IRADQGDRQCRRRYAGGDPEIRTRAQAAADRPGVGAPRAGTRARNRPDLRVRLKSNIWVAAYLRRCQTENIFGAVRRRGAEEAGAIFVKLALLDGNALLFGPASQTAYDESRPAERMFAQLTPAP